MNKAIRALEKRIKLYETALDRILGLPDGSVRLAAPGYVRTVMAARRPASYRTNSLRSLRGKTPSGPR
jgi:hypothetical protein